MEMADGEQSVISDPYLCRGQSYPSTAFHSLTVLVAESKFTPTFTSFLPSAVYGTRYPLLNACRWVQLLKLT